MRDCVPEVERDKLFSLPEDERGNSEFKHGDLRNRETAQAALERADECQSQTVTLACVTALASRASCRR